ncbi:heterokaryon incompatibility protein-domain-containing protein [Pisolithus marmoratus]|nr:heterokaryon incompatibility protein-domain-containing protein [Pisolithus marmoratus]
MRLIDVATMLNIKTNFDEEKEVPRTTKILKEFYGSGLTKKEYVILSHCWGVEEQGEQEVLFEDMKQLLIVSDEERKEIRGRTGYKKIIDTCRQAQTDGLEWAWIDTCCINKESSAELSEAINSMYEWYANVKLCYAYLTTLSGTLGRTEQYRRPPRSGFREKWEWIGDKAELAWTLTEITRIPKKVLNEGLLKALSTVKDSNPSVAEIFSWAADRTTTREEDRAYSLLGLLGVHVPLHNISSAFTIQIPTFVLAIATINPNLRSDVLFATTFFLTRIALHIRLGLSFLQRARLTEESMGPGIIMACIYSCYMHFGSRGASRDL